MRFCTVLLRCLFILKPFPAMTVAHWCYSNLLADFRFEVMALAKPRRDLRWVQCSIDLALLKRRKAMPNPTLGTNLFSSFNFPAALPHRCNRSDSCAANNLETTRALHTLDYLPLITLFETKKIIKSRSRAKTAVVLVMSSVFTHLPGKWG